MTPINSRNMGFKCVSGVDDVAPHNNLARVARHVIGRQLTEQSRVSVCVDDVATPNSLCCIARHVTGCHLIHETRVQSALVGDNIRQAPPSSRQGTRTVMEQSAHRLTPPLDTPPLAAPPTVTPLLAAPPTVTPLLAAPPPVTPLLAAPPPGAQATPRLKGRWRGRGGGASGCPLPTAC
jgi:hypothetical protein